MNPFKKMLPGFLLSIAAPPEDMAALPDTIYTPNGAPHGSYLSGKKRKKRKVRNRMAKQSRRNNRRNK